MKATTEILPGQLWMGAHPETPQLGIDTYVLVALERRPAPWMQRAHHVPLDDTSDAAKFQQQLMQTHAAASLAVKAVRRGERVLISCNQGRNRSGLVTALAVRQLAGTSGMHALARVKHLRDRDLLAPNFLSLVNPLFVRYLAELPPTPRSA